MPLHSIHPLSQARSVFNEFGTMSVDHFLPSSYSYIQ